jgi:hypothetical protein
MESFWPDAEAEMGVRYMLSVNKDSGDFLHQEEKSLDSVTDYEKVCGEGVDCIHRLPLGVHQLGVRHHQAWSVWVLSLLDKP